MTQSDIRVKSYYYLNLLRASIFNFERLDILGDSIEHPSKKLLSFEFTKSFYFQFLASRFIKGLNRTSESKVIVVWIWSEPLFSILSVSIYYRTQSVIGVKSYCDLHFLRASVFHYQRLDILRDSIGHLSWQLLLFAFFTSFNFQFRPSRYITRLNRKSKSILIVIWICSELLYWISSLSIYYGTQSKIRVKTYCRLNLLKASVFNFDHLDILRDSIEHLRKNYCHLNLLGASVFNFERLDICWNSIGLPS